MFCCKICGKRIIEIKEIAELPSWHHFVEFDFKDIVCDECKKEENSGTIRVQNTGE